ENISIQYELAPDLYNVQVDPSQMDQVILNLTINARDAMPQGGKLLIETKNVELDEIYTRSLPHLSPGSYVLLSVTDTGHGMSPEVLDKIFEPFFTTKVGDKGTG